MYTVGMEIRENVPLAPLTTFKIGGAARYFVEVNGEDEIREALRWARDRKIQHHLIAGGSNLLVPDEGVDALVIRLAQDMNDLRGRSLEAEAGCNLLDLIQATGGAGLSGWEKMAGIPGTLGGAVRGNAGAFGTEIKDVVAEVEALNRETGEMHVFDNDACEFSYRNSFFKQYPEWIILCVRVTLTQGDGYESRLVIDQTIAEREKRHLQNVRAAGSFFMNPPAPLDVQKRFESEKKTKAREGRVPAGWLIEKAGMKGARIGGAIASVQHPNYLVNERDATAEDVRRLAELIREKVHAQSGIVLVEEVSFLL